METNELRIGNYVSSIHASDKFYAKVKKLDLSRCYYGDFHSDYKDLKPIPLTEEWLLKLGFENDHGEIQQDYSLYKNIGASMNMVFYKGDASCLSLYQHWKLIDFTSSLIKYVHQLQNLYFVLTGKELEIND